MGLAWGHRGIALSAAAERTFPEGSQKVHPFFCSYFLNEIQNLIDTHRREGYS